MAGEPYDWQRDEGLDFGDDPQAEPETGEVKDEAYRAYVTQDYYGIEDET